MLTLRNCCYCIFIDFMIFAVLSVWRRLTLIIVFSQWHGYRPTVKTFCMHAGGMDASTVQNNHFMMSVSTVCGRRLMPIFLITFFQHKSSGKKISFIKRLVGLHHWYTFVTRSTQLPMESENIIISVFFSKQVKTIMSKHLLQLWI